MTENDKNYIKALFDEQNKKEEETSTIWGFPQKYAVIIILIMGVIVYWNTNRGKTEFEVELLNNITTTQKDIEEIKDDISEIKEENGNIKEEIDDLKDNTLSKQEIERYFLEQSKVDQKQWEYINELRH